MLCNIAKHSLSKDAQHQGKDSGWYKQRNIFGDLHDRSGNDSVRGINETVDRENQFVTPHFRNGLTIRANKHSEKKIALIALAVVASVSATTETQVPSDMPSLYPTQSPVVAAPTSSTKAPKIFAGKEPKTRRVRRNQ
eukprot:Nitzschia sp. Nitz4//scaffold338_size18487//14373//14971//NITZ4_008790-RA/size18487-processed-gene-0.15-mRNA-1//-1//CDS//3329548341//1560//frame0